MKISDLKIAFEFWLRDYRALAWEHLEDEEKTALCNYHWREFCKKVQELEE